MNNEILNQEADVILNNPKEFKIKIHGLLSIFFKKITLTIYPLKLYQLIRISKLIRKINIDFTSDKDRKRSLIWDLVYDNTDLMVNIITESICGLENKYPKWLIKRILIKELDQDDLQKLITVVTSFVDAKSFIDSIILINALNVQSVNKVSPRTEEKIASGI